MSRWEESNGPSFGVPPESSRPQSIGTYLARQRMLRGISLEELAQVTRIPIRSLERLESGSYDGVTDGFVRGFVRTVAESLGLEPTDTVARMLREPTLDDEVGSAPSPILRRLLVFGLGTLLLVLAVGLVRAFTQSGESAEPKSVEQVFRRDAVRLLAEGEGARLHRVEERSADPVSSDVQSGD